MANGCCSVCKEILTEDNCSSSVFKLGYGQCRICNAAWARRRRRGDFSYAPRREGLCSKCDVVLTKDNSRPAVFKAGYGYCYACTIAHRKQDREKDPCKFTYTILKSAAKRNNRSLDISLEEYRNIVEGKLCSYCYRPLSDYFYGYGLDRVDHNEGYTLGNCVPCCWSCNSLKGRIEGLGFPPDRAVELLREINEIRKSEKRYGYNPSKHNEPRKRNRVF